MLFFTMINYSDNPFLKLKNISPMYYKLYNFSVLFVYFGLLIIGWYFINLAYTINTPSYDILCFGCNIGSHLFKISMLLVWLFFLYFYILNEIRFRYAYYSGKTNEALIKQNNIIFILLALFFVILTMFVIL